MRPVGHLAVTMTQFHDIELDFNATLKTKPTPKDNRMKEQSEHICYSFVWRNVVEGIRINELRLTPRVVAALGLSSVILNMMQPVRPTSTTMSGTLLYVSWRQGGGGITVHKFYVIMDPLCMNKVYGYTG